MSEHMPPIPHAARIYDYLIGGDDYTPADQAAAGAMTGLLPSLPKWLPMLRDYLPRMAAMLYEQGFRHFVDFASGLPHNHLHSALGEDARIVYSDIDPEIVARGREILRDRPNTRYVAADVTRPLGLLNDPAVADFLGRPERLAVGLSGVAVFLQPAAFGQVLDTLYDALPSGSKAFITYETQDPGLSSPPLTTF
ncbi:MAG TPA: SAM-dependent methyltransferase, partial [Herpetosiphonaceae bacterium]|nr:SAM-dependent methyltransferase [Herpetosiphonaceae bacterium]